MDAPTLTVDFFEERRQLNPGDSLTFGRSADLVIDTNPALHRVLGQLFWHEGSWWLANQGSTTAIELSDQDSVSSMKVAPGAIAKIGFPVSTVGFRAGNAAYAFEITLQTECPSVPQAALMDDEATRIPDPLAFTPEQRLLVAALAEPWIRSGAPAPLPTNRMVANTLGWSATKFNRKLDTVCRKLADGGVSGLVGTSDSLARDRRQRLVEYSIYTGLVDESDLELLAGFRAQRVA